MSGLIGQIAVKPSGVHFFFGFAGLSARSDPRQTSLPVSFHQRPLRSHSLGRSRNRDFGNDNAEAATTKRASC
eukprot:4735080-Pyramimonas_sp.AAC.1